MINSPGILNRYNTMDILCFIRLSLYFTINTSINMVSNMIIVIVDIMKEGIISLFLSNFLLYP